MSLQQQLREDMKTAMKAREKTRLATIRLLLAAIKNVEIDKQRELKEDEELSVLTSQAKRRRESIELYEQGGRQELADQERAELGVIEEYLPKQLSSEEAREIILEVIASVGASTRKDMGKVMKEAMPRLKGRFPGKEVKGLVMAELN